MPIDLPESETAAWLEGRGPMPAWLGSAPSGAPRREGFTVFLTGLPGAGKSTLARELQHRLAAAGREWVAVLDGDVVRRHLSTDLGFSKSDRDRNVRRVGRLAGEIARRGGAAVCALIAPFDGARREARREAERHGCFVLVHVATPLEVCERRDAKGNYSRARQGLLPAFTGVSDPYEPPEDAELSFDLSKSSPGDSVGTLIAWLRARGLA